MSGQGTFFFEQNDLASRLPCVSPKVHQPPPPLLGTPFLFFSSFTTLSFPLSQHGRPPPTQRITASAFFFASPPFSPPTTSTAACLLPQALAVIGLTCIRSTPRTSSAFSSLFFARARGEAEHLGQLLLIGKNFLHHQPGRPLSSAYASPIVDSIPSLPIPIAYP